MLTKIQNSTITVTADTKGAELQSVVGSNGISYLWDGNPQYWSGRAPLLFPFVGSVRDGIAHSDAGDITLPRHGFARKLDWELEKADDQSMTFRVASSEETLKNYPYPFEARVCYSLGDSSVTTSFTVRNTGKTSLPFCFGGHTGFHVPLVEGEAYDDYIIEFTQKETADCPQNNLSTGLIADGKRNRFLSDKKSFRLNHVLFRGDALIFDRLKSRSALLYSEKSGRGVRVDFQEMEYFAVWSPFADSPFVCLEPWTGMCTLESEDDVFEHKLGIRRVEPGKEETVSFTVTVF